MQNKHSLIPIIVAVLSVLAFNIALSHLWGTPVKQIFVGIVVYAFYGVLVVAYLLRFAMIFVGVFAIYRVLQERYQGRFAA